MSHLENEQRTTKSFSLRSVLLIVLLAGLGVGATAYSLANVFATTNNSSTQNAQVVTNNGHWYGYSRELNGPAPGWTRPWSGDQNGSFVSFRAFSTVSNVTVTGFNIVDATHFTVNLSFGGSGSAPAITVVVLALGLSGSNTVSSGWTSPTTVSVNMAGNRSLSTSTAIRTFILPLTGS